MGVCRLRWLLWLGVRNAAGLHPLRSCRLDGLVLWFDVLFSELLSPVLLTTAPGGSPLSPFGERPSIRRPHHAAETTHWRQTVGRELWHPGQPTGLETFPGTLSCQVLYLDQPLELIRGRPLEAVLT